MTDPIHTAQQMNEAAAKIAEEWFCRNCHKWFHPAQPYCCNAPYWDRRRTPEETAAAIRDLTARIPPLDDEVARVVVDLVELADYVEQDPPVNYEYRAATAMREAADLITRLAGELAAVKAEKADTAALNRMEAEGAVQVLMGMKARAEKTEAEAAALRAQIARQDEVIDAYNGLLRSSSQIAKREGIERRIASTNWDAFHDRLTVCLHKYHADWLASSERRKTL